MLFEDFGRRPADLATAQRWTNDFNATSPVYPDDNYLVFDLYDRRNYQPQYFLIDKWGVIQNYWENWNDAVIEAAVEAELAR